MVVLAGFNGWNWFLALMGTTTIEFWKRNAILDWQEEYFIDYAYPEAADNLYSVFGTHKLMRIFSPSLRSIPYNGIEFSFLQKDLGFDENGEKDWREQYERSPADEESADIEMT